jgi:error-prone DNA polymerase
MAYAELQVSTNFSFLRGASHPQELVTTAAALGLAAIGVADRNTLAGVVRAHSAAKRSGLRFLPGARLDFQDATPSLICYPTDREAYGRLTRLLSRGKLRAEKGDCHLTGADLLEHAEGQLLLAIPPADPDAAFEAELARLAGELRGRVYLTASRGYGARDVRRIDRLAELARTHRTPLLATNDVLFHGPERRPLQDVLTCIREKRTIHDAGFLLEANAERCLKPPQEMARLFKRWPYALERTLEVVERCGFDLSQLRYEYPHEPVPPGKSAMQHLSDLAFEGAKMRYPEGVPAKVTALLDKELALIAELDYPHYFLTVHDVVRWARERGILCQGRGSAANSAVCYCLGVTAVNPLEHGVLFERFLSKERSEPPDIDVDFEHERREEVIQYVYGRYGRERAAICATVIHYRPRMAIREVGKALGLTEDLTSALADTVWGHWGDGMPDDHVRQAGLDPENPEIRRATALTNELIGFPRHLSQHVGGFILTERRLDETVPIGNAAMKDRTFIEWDKDDIDDLGLMKVDVLALGMLSCLKRGLDLMAEKGVTVRGRPITDIDHIPGEDPAVYAMLSKADSVGVFQVESRAQMSMLPRMKPKTFYDLVIEVAIVRPGPIQGDMVHPYLRRREGREPVEFPSPAPEHGPPDELHQVLGRTLGVPLFQEQAMRLAIEGAKFTPGEANGLRRAMATFKSLGDLGVYRTKFVEGMVARGYQRDFAERCFKQIEGFGSYGFPESHAASFAKLVYASAWIKKHHPDVFCAAILNSQPMGFYQPAQLVRDAREHGVEVRAPDVSFSDWDCTLEEEIRDTHRFPAPRGGVAEPGNRCVSLISPNPLRPVRLGLRQVRGLVEDEGRRLVAARQEIGDTHRFPALPSGDAPGPGNRYVSPISFEALVQAARLSRRTVELLAEADAFRSLGLDRRAALWMVKGLETRALDEEAPLLARMGKAAEPAPELPALRLPEHVAEDYRTTSLSLKAHPCRFFRERLARGGVRPTRDLKTIPNGRRAKIAGLVLIRQRPGTAKGVTFVTIEDETGVANLVVWKDRFEADRRLVMTARFLAVEGKVQREGEVIHLVAERFDDLSAWLQELREGEAVEVGRSRDFH